MPLHIDIADITAIFIDAIDCHYFHYLRSPAFRAATLIISAITG
jgi:hypothetical protein